MTTTFAYEVRMSTETIHTALLGIAGEGDDSIPLSDGLSLVRPNDGLLRHRWDWVQGLRRAAGRPLLKADLADE